MLAVSAASPGEVVTSSGAASSGPGTHTDAVSLNMLHPPFEMGYLKYFRFLFV